ncbi:hypothetical protein Nepgr_027702 [Nepenthes gracilis]|uniref:Transducin/WD40 repeat-like superfamily protein n=1 Tax=Nepenthes gracilis TaxID=150966 RepID=A0AAD3Y3D4_NEPGR|nr:hypothetical protein Nepgr_027702 [Nepenthes gracilis]
MEKFQLLNHFRFPWAVNHTSVSPDRKLITVVGNDQDGLLVDAQTGKNVATAVGHQDYPFASAWHLDGRTLATGNQDKTCRVWDIRNYSRPTAVFNVPATFTSLAGRRSREAESKALGQPGTGHEGSPRTAWQRVTLRLLTSLCDNPWVKMGAIATMIVPTLGTTNPAQKDDELH